MKGFCLCGHHRTLHTHYRSGTDCAHPGCSCAIWRSLPVREVRIYAGASILGLVAIAASLDAGAGLVALIFAVALLADLAGWAHARRQVVEARARRRP